METTIAVGVDIGGTSTKLGVVTREGRILQSDTLLTPPDQPGEVLLAAILERTGRMIARCRSEGQPLAGIGLSICGYLDPTGETPAYINLHALEGLPIPERFRQAFGLPAVMDNDMNAGALGEYLFGAGQGADRLMVVTVGTGIGVGVIAGGQVLRFSQGTTGNPGHILVQPDGPLCTAGCRGCLESVASAGAIARQAEDIARSERPSLLKARLAEKGALTAEDLYRAAEAGDPAAAEAWEQVGRWLGRGAASWVEIFNPTLIVLGGGVGQAGRWLLAPMEAELRRAGEPYFTRQVQAVRQSALGREVAMLGAAAFYLYPGTAPVWKGR